MMRLVSDLILLAIRFVLLHSIRSSIRDKDSQCSFVAFDIPHALKSRSKSRFVALRSF